jgi:long-chain acyl-CoA synthetase
MPNLAALLADHEDGPPRTIATEIVGGGTVQWTLAQLAALAARWQAAFEQIGLTTGDRIAISARNSMQWLAIDQAALGLGLATVALDPQASTRIAAAAIAHGGADLLLIDSASRANQIVQAGPPIKNVVMLRKLQHGRSRLISLEDFLPDAVDTPFYAAELEEDQLATISYQRIAKDGIRGIMLSHANLLAATHAQQVAGVVPAGHTVLACGSFCELFHRVTAYYVPLACGAQLALPNTGSNLQQALADVLPETLTIRGEPLQRLADLLRQPLREAGGTVASLNSALDAGIRTAQGQASWWDKLLYNAQSARIKQAAHAATGGRLVRVLSAEAVPSQVLRQLSAHGLTVMNGLSLAASSGLVSINAPPDIQLHTCGPCLPGMEAVLSPHGELLLRGLALSQGYWNDPAATQSDFQPEGWVHTGHKARLDGGHIIIEGFMTELAPQDTQQVPIPHTASITDSTTTH